ncbi:MAG TPA: Uma2 family endonuclease [Gemmataceae bacterium]|jgi:Uma2 family endonuclease|nr:Uma2 family endonuclease [Gemmataceae bacterium]
MSTAPTRRITPQEYLAIERAAETRSEYDAGEMFAMSGASWHHNLVKDNLAREIGQQLKEGPCRVVTSDLRVKVDATGLYTYPDIVVVCDEPHFEDDVHDTLLNPRVVIEVLSDSTEKYDRGKKFGHYQRVASLQEYVLVAQDEPVVERYERQPTGWLLTTVRGLDAEFAFASIAATVSLREIYRGVTFDGERTNG